MVCSSAAGRCIPPLVLFKRKALNSKLVEDEVPGTMYGIGGSGWMDSETFSDWFKHHFLLHAPAVRPLLLLMDSHSSHFHPGFIELAAKEKVVVFCLPPNSTHLLQPLDKGVFKSLKSHWFEACHNFMRKYPGQVVTEYSFSGVFKTAFYKSMTMSNITTSFRITGVYPFNRNVVSAVEPSKAEQRARYAGMPFLPLLSPRPSKSKNCKVHVFVSIFITLFLLIRYVFLLLSNCFNVHTECTT